MRNFETKIAEAVLKMKLKMRMEENFDISLLRLVCHVMLHVIQT